MKRIQKLRQQLAAERIEALLITDVTNRRYITGFTGSSGFALVTPDKAVLITDFRYVTQAAEQAPHFELIQHKESIWEAVADVCRDTGIRELAFDKGTLTFAEYEELQNRAENVVLKPTSALVEQLRLIKDDSELAILQAAADIADRTYDHILTFIEAGMTEREVELELEFTMRKMGATSSSFDIIVASGKRSALPHGAASDKRIERGDLVTMDYGALYKGYCSDITRTVMVGEPSDKQRRIYDIVLRAQKRTVAEMKPGMTGKEVDALARDVIAAEGYGDNFGHGTGHGLGLDVHEEPRLSHRNNEGVLKPGMVVTVEPGIYIPDFGGVRIEDDIVITETGCERLTKSTKELIIL